MTECYDVDIAQGLLAASNGDLTVRHSSKSLACSLTLFLIKGTIKLKQSREQ